MVAAAAHALIVFRRIAPSALFTLLIVLGGAFESKSAGLRALPYPHSHVITFVSDADEQAPWYAASLHRLLNEKLGLPVSDSLWVHGSSSGSSFLFRGPGALNREPSGIDNHATYALLLRQW